jgi:ABC-type amino acid transport substrate-binding protein
MMSRPRLAALSALLLLWSGFAAAEDVTFALDTFPPYTRLENAKLVGPAVDVVERSARASGMNPVIVPMSSKRAPLELLAGTIDIWVSRLRPEFADKMLAGGPLMTIGVSLIWRPGTPPLRDLAGAAGIRIVAIASYPYLNLRDRLGKLDPPAEIVDMRSLEQLAGALDSGHAPYALVHDSMLADPAPHTGPPFERLTLGKLEVHFLAARANPHGQDLIDRLNAAYDTLPADQRMPEYPD